MFEPKPICAIATGAGQSGIGIIRISGTHATACASKLYSGKVPFDTFVSHHAYYGAVVDPIDSAVLDQALFLIMRAPNSYTGEDVVEIQAHGNPYVLARIVALLCQQGARLAQPGEFTRRSFLNGKIDLVQAESVMELISSKSDAQHKMALAGLRGQLSKTVQGFKDALLSILGELEASIDFSDQEIALGSRAELQARIGTVLCDLRKVLAGYDGGKRIRTGFNVAIVGQPNVGKSSLMNALLQDDRAIVSDVSGTTRDVLIEGLSLKGLAVNIIDTAGLRETEEPIEQEGVRRARNALLSSDLVLCLLDSHVALSSDDLNVLRDCEKLKTIVVLTKSDLDAIVDVELVRTKFPVFRQFSLVSAKNLSGLLQLRSDMRVALYDEDGDALPEIALIRHKHAIEAAERGVSAAQSAIARGSSAELPALDLKNALESLSGITGETTVDDVLDKVFEQFCVGK